MQDDEPGVEPTSEYIDAAAAAGFEAEPQSDLGAAAPAADPFPGDDSGDDSLPPSYSARPVEAEADADVSSDPLPGTSAYNDMMDRRRASERAKQPSPSDAILSDYHARKKKAAIEGFWQENVLGDGNFRFVYRLAKLESGTLAKADAALCIYAERSRKAYLVFVTEAKLAVALQGSPQRFVYRDGTPMTKFAAAFSVLVEYFKLDGVDEACGFEVKVQDGQLVYPSFYAFTKQGQQKLLKVKQNKVLEFCSEQLSALGRGIGKRKDSPAVSAASVQSAAAPVAPSESAALSSVPFSIGLRNLAWQSNKGALRSSDADNSSVAPFDVQVAIYTPAPAPKPSLLALSSAPRSQAAKRQNRAPADAPRPLVLFSESQIAPHSASADLGAIGVPTAEQPSVSAPARPLTFVVYRQARGRPLKVPAVLSEADPDIIGTATVSDAQRLATVAAAMGPVAIGVPLKTPFAADAYLRLKLRPGATAPQPPEGALQPLLSNPGGRFPDSDRPSYFTVFGPKNRVDFVIYNHDRQRERARSASKKRSKKHSSPQATRPARPQSGASAATRQSLVSSVPSDAVRDDVLVAEVRAAREEAELARQQVEQLTAALNELRSELQSGILQSPPAAVPAPAPAVAPLPSQSADWSSSPAAPAAPEQTAAVAEQPAPVSAAEPAPAPEQPAGEPERASKPDYSFFGNAPQHNETPEEAAAGSPGAENSAAEAEIMQEAQAQQQPGSPPAAPVEMYRFKLRAKSLLSAGHDASKTNPVVHVLLEPPADDEDAPLMLLGQTETQLGTTEPDFAQIVEIPVEHPGLVAQAKDAANIMLTLIVYDIEQSRAANSEVNDATDFVGQCTVKLTSLVAAEKRGADLPFLLRNLDDDAKDEQLKANRARVIVTRL